MGLVGRLRLLSELQTVAQANGFTLLVVHRWRSPANFAPCRTYRVPLSDRGYYRTHVGAPVADH